MTVTSRNTTGTPTKRKKTTKVDAVIKGYKANPGRFAGTKTEKTAIREQAKKNVAKRKAKEAAAYKKLTSHGERTVRAGQPAAKAKGPPRQQRITTDRKAQERDMGMKR